MHLAIFPRKVWVLMPFPRITSIHRERETKLDSSNYQTIAVLSTVYVYRLVLVCRNRIYWLFYLCFLLPTNAPKRKALSLETKVAIIRRRSNCWKCILIRMWTSNDDETFNGAIQAESLQDGADVSQQDRVTYAFIDGSSIAVERYRKSFYSFERKSKHSLNFLLRIGIFSVSTKERNFVERDYTPGRKTGVAAKR